ncbi:hypothetical protein [Bacillus sp. UNCCL81]|uniref:hypothetical protein n=1 Tax=Bacillus sp. UNCCL81 TaxID=1502755 RepID=UPI0008E6E76B|nr:hypothetical protein [Bacillus sp. UNCCL81]SFD59648.1 hypothetical protein SAMN02799633_04214 [Bacillus sp. UNCCL81]
MDSDSKESTPGEIVLATMDKQLGMSTFILETTNGYHVDFVLEKPLYISNRKNFIGLKSAKRISENIRLALAEILLGIDTCCNHFGFFRMSNNENLVWCNEEYIHQYTDLMDCSIDQDKGHRRNMFTFFSNSLP